MLPPMSKVNEFYKHKGTKNTKLSLFLCFLMFSLCASCLCVYFFSLGVTLLISIINNYFPQRHQKLCVLCVFAKNIYSPFILCLLNPKIFLSEGAKRIKSRRKERKNLLLKHVFVLHLTILFAAGNIRGVLFIVLLREQDKNSTFERCLILKN